MKQSLQKWFGLGDQQEGDKEANPDEIRHIPVEKITANPFQPRTIFQEEKIAELAQSIRTHGLLQPITVREKEEHFEIIAGERRWRAVLSLGMKEVPAIVKNFNDTETASVALIENLQREELTAIEEASAYAELLELHGLTQESLAQRLGKGQSTVANKMRLLHLSKETQQALKNKQITERHARALLQVKEEAVQNHILEMVVQRELNVKQTEQMIKDNAEPKQTKKPKPARRHFSKDTRIAVNTIRESVEMVENSGMGIDTEEEDQDEFYQITIRIPKK